MKIHAGLMTQNELYDLSRNVASLLPHVDSLTIIDGGSTDGTVPYMRNLTRQDPKVRLFLHPWKDNFPEQRNQYLLRIREIATEGDWVLAVDPDEFLEESALRELRRLAEVVPQKPEGFRRVGFRCRSVSLRGPDRIWQGEDSYWKGLYYRWSPALRYDHDGEGAVHERLVGADPVYMVGQHPEFPTLWYEHRKQENVVWARGVRNYFIGGGGPNLGSRNHRWVELRRIGDRLGLRSWRDMHAYLLAGQIDNGLKDWIVAHRHESGWDGASEQREWYKYYFRMLHPEEEPPQHQGESIA